MQTHVEERFHVDMPDGKHKEFTEQEFEDYSTQRNDISSGDLQTLKESARHKGIFLFKECPFCGGYPDDVEKSCKDPNTAEAQIRLRQHIKRHLQDIALFLPPYREDVFQEDEDSDTSNFSRGTAGFRNVEHLDENLTVCGKENCDCKDLAKNSQDLPEIMSSMHALKDAEVSNQNEEHADLWEALFPESSRYSKSDLTEKDCLDDQHLKHFLTASSRPQNETSLGEVDAAARHWIDSMFPKSSSGIDHQMMQRFYFNLHHPGTCEWMVHSASYQSWLSNEGGCTLYCPGFLGAGKSVLTSVAIDDIAQRFQLRDDKVGIAFVYCNYETSTAENVQNLLLDILDQLARGLDYMPSTLNVLSRTNSFPRRPTVVEDVQLALSLICAEYARVYIFVDGIGETRDPQVNASLLYELGGLQLKHGINLFVTSRVMDLPFRGDFRRYYIALRADEEDLRAVLESRLQQSELTDDLDDEIDWLVEKADGM